MLVSSFKHFIYWHIPKTGGTSLHTALKKYIDIDSAYYRKELDDINNYEFLRYHRILKGLPTADHGFKAHFGFPDRASTMDYFDTNFKPIRHIDHINQEVGSEILRSIKNNRNSRLWNINVDKLFYEFTMVRDPIDRMISLYNQGTPNKILQEKFPTFGHFIKAMAFYYQHPGHLPDFYDSQVLWIKSPYTDNIEVFKLEKQEEWFPTLCKTLNLNVDTFPIENVSPNKVVNRDTISNEEKQFCYKFLEEEYDLLGY